jgi:hypothetical protein
MKSRLGGTPEPPDGTLVGSHWSMVLCGLLFCTANNIVPQVTVLSFYIRLRKSHFKKSFSYIHDRDAMSEAREIIDKILTEERVPEFEFGAIYPSTIVEILDRGILVQLHPEMQPILIPNSQLDAKKVCTYFCNNFFGILLGYGYNFRNHFLDTKQSLILKLTFIAFRSMYFTAVPAA